jgi:hypothetical protein
VAEDADAAIWVMLMALVFTPFTPPFCPTAVFPSPAVNMLNALFLYASKRRWILRSLSESQLDCFTACLPAPHARGRGHTVPVCVDSECFKSRHCPAAPDPGRHGLGSLGRGPGTGTE